MSIMHPPSNAPQQPFYIAVADYDDESPQMRQLYGFCHALNKRGFEAYVFGAKVINGQLWTPMLTLEQRVAHYKAGKKPIWIHAAADTAVRQQNGWTMSYSSELTQSAPLEKNKGQVEWGRDGENASFSLNLSLPWTLDLESQKREEFPASRSKRLVFAKKYLQMGGKIQTCHSQYENLADLGDATAPDRQRREALCTTELIYCYEPGVVITEARLAGCIVIYVSNDQTLRTPPTSAWDTLGTAWTDTPQTLAKARLELEEFRRRYTDILMEANAAIDHFIAISQQTVATIPFKTCWTEQAIESLGLLIVDPKERHRHADQAKYGRIRKQFKNWRKRTTLREVDGEIYAEHVAKCDLPDLAVCIFVTTPDFEGLAQTLDSLQQNFVQPKELHILADFACPIDPKELGAHCRWHDLASALTPFRQVDAEWLLLLESGVKLEAHAVVEFALSAREPAARLIYSDEVFVNAEGHETPHFKPDLNIEWLRSTNYLGSVLAVPRALWQQGPAPLDFDQSYALALEWSNTPHAIIHIDTVLYRATGNVSLQREAKELAYLQAYLRTHQHSVNILAHKIAGCRQLEYKTERKRQASIIIPTGHQLGYLRCLLNSLKNYAEPEMCEVILVTQAQHENSVRMATRGIDLGLALRVVVMPHGPYRHGLALNAGAEAARGDVLVFADDDTEIIQRQSLKSLTAYFDQEDVGCVAPRLVLQIGDNPMLQSGPMILGIGNWASSYNGEQCLLDEQGVFARLQTSQDVPTVAGHFFLVRREHWANSGGFDADACHTFTTVHDFCIRAGRSGLRHIWTPVSNVLHQGGKTIEALGREPGRTYEIKSDALRERQVFLNRWIKHIANDRSYNRHLSLYNPYDVDPDIVVDWMTSRKDRPNVIAFPISSGSGQYRVVEPLNSLQQAGLAQTCVVFPLSASAYRTPSVLDITRANPDRVIVQHSIGDAHLQLLRDYRRTNPDLFTIQMVDDLFHDLPQTHHLHNIHQREGYVRMREAMSLSDRVIVSTQPLADIYCDHCTDIRVVPNMLDDRVWGQYFRAPQPRRRLRVGWAGAGQHLGDLQMIEQVVAAFRDEVDWIFMGMCPDSLRPYIKEFHPFVSYVDYPAKLASLDLDIAIAPLEDNPFNRCKSNLRLLEYGAMGWPVVCSDVYPFRTENPPVLRVPNEKEAWIESVRRLIDDSALRHQMGQQLNQWVSDHFYLSKNTGKWFSAIFD